MGMAQQPEEAAGLSAAFGRREEIARKTE